MSSTLMQASNQWASRPADQRFISLADLNTFVQHQRANSKATVTSSRRISLAPVEGSNTGLVAVAQNGGTAELTNWSFGQIAQRAGAPAGYLRTLPAPMAADCVNYGLHYARDIEDIGVLAYKNGGPAVLRAATGPNYGRIWNATITQALVDRFGDGETFRVPGEFGKRVAVTKANTTLFASDRDMFVFLADEDHRIEIANRRNGQSGSLARGFFVWNSEVGSATFGIATFLFDYVCCNRIVWGAEGYQEITIRHTAGAPDKWLERVAPALEQYADSSSVSIIEGIKAAQKARVDNVDEFLAKRFTKSQVSGIKAAHMTDEQRPIETLWDAATGITAYARGIDFQDNRVAIEREAGKVLDLATR